MWARKVSNFSFVLSRFTVNFPSIKAVVFLKQTSKQKLLRKWSPVQFQVFILKLLNSYTFLMEYLIALYREGKKNPKKPTNQNYKTKTQQKNPNTTNQKKFLVVLRGSLTCQNRVVKHIPLSPLFS